MRRKLSWNKYLKFKVAGFANQKIHNTQKEEHMPFEVYQNDIGESSIQDAQQTFNVKMFIVVDVDVDEEMSYCYDSFEIT